MTTVIDATADTRPVLESHGYVTRPWRGSRYEYVARPKLSVRIEHDGDCTIMVEDGTGIYGVGDTPWAAWRDLRAALMEHLDVLRRQQGLSPSLERQFAYLSDRLKTS